MLSFDDIGAEAIPGLNLRTMSGLLRLPVPAAASQERYSAGNKPSARERRGQGHHQRQADVNQLVPFKYKWAWKNTSPPVPIIGCRRKST